MKYHYTSTTMAEKQNPKTGNSLAVQWLGLCVLTARAWVRSLIGELRFCKPRGTAKTKKKKPKTIPQTKLAILRTSEDVEQRKFS